MPTSKSGNRFNNSRGFSLVEIIVVLSIISIMSVVAAPKLSIFFSGKRKNVSLVRNYIAKTFDDAFLNYRNNYLIIHLNEPDDKNADRSDGLFSGTNSLSVLNIENTKFVLSQEKLLQPLEFNNNFIFDSVLMDDTTEVQNGYVIIPFYKEGYSVNRIIYIRYNDDNYLTVFISKFEKEPYIFEGKLNYENIWKASQ
ncbi:MAG: prepilin-type N-terminal cleavage/methylation domain-containing protein [Spirochaetes bacterium]|nr:prepilin-type N-terminal cleavage/methylation domain-containing protein [Spirochaetota bacterium]